MKKLVLLLAFVSLSASAGYRSYSGDSYQFDMNDPYDRSMYQVDAGAQMRDMYNKGSNAGHQLNRQLDQGMYQNGGGYYDNY